MRYSTFILAMLMVVLAACASEEPAQEPFTGEELIKFVKDGTVVNREIRALCEIPEGSQLVRGEVQREVYARLQKRNWNVRRFYYIYGQCFEFTEFMMYQKDSDEFALSVEQTPANVNRDKVDRLLEKQNRVMGAMREQVDKDVPVSEQVYIREQFRTIRSFLTSSVIFFPPD